MRKTLILGDKKVLISNEDFERVSKFKWYVSQGYARRTTNDKTLLHRFVMNAGPGQLVDHINQNKLDNRRQNLRFANKSINAINSKIRTDSTTKVKGVSWNKEKRKYEAYITLNGKRQFLGYFMTLEEACYSRLAAA